ncbi:MAG TPA: hypothetical protein PK543_03485 [Candidatus Saccharibacteria bacterium]|nr:hypothetical protein [Candidatus Saccharibacteria bacterium]
MTERRQAVELEVIEKNLKPITLDQHFMEVQRREAERQTGWLVASAGILVGSINYRFDDIRGSEGAKITTKKLAGLDNKLNAGTLVYYEGIRLPTDTSQETVDQFIRSSYKVEMTLGRISLNEPGFPVIKPIKTDFDAYFYIDEVDKEKGIAEQGIERYLNRFDSLITVEQASEIDRTIKVARGAIGVSMGNLYQHSEELLTRTFDSRQGLKPTVD